MSFTIISWIVFAVAFLLVFRFLRHHGRGLPQAWEWSLRQLRRPWPRPAVLREDLRNGRFRSLRILAYRLTLLSFLVLLGSGFLPPMLSGDAPGGWMLMIHMLAAPVFLAALTVLVVLAAERQRFRPSDSQRLRDILRGKDDEATLSTLRRALFWLLVLLALAGILAVALAMTLLAGTAGQRLLTALHGYSMLLFSIALLALAALRIIGEEPGMKKETAEQRIPHTGTAEKRGNSG